MFLSAQDAICSAFLCIITPCNKLVQSTLTAQRNLGPISAEEEIMGVITFILSDQQNETWLLEDTAHLLWWKHIFRYSSLKGYWYWNSTGFQTAPLKTMLLHTPKLLTLYNHGEASLSWRFSKTTKVHNNLSLSKTTPYWRTSSHVSTQFFKKSHGVQDGEKQQLAAPGLTHLLLSWDSWTAQDWLLTN